MTWAKLKLPKEALPITVETTIHNISKNCYYRYQVQIWVDGDVIKTNLRMLNIRGAVLVSSEIQEMKID